MLCDTSPFCPVTIGLDDHRASGFGFFDASSRCQEGELNTFVLPYMRSLMTVAPVILCLPPLFLLMSIAHHAGIYNSMMEYACRASIWHQVPSVMS
jgi:hypothetical protein